MGQSGELFTVGTFGSAFVGAAIGVMVDRVYRRIESVPLFRLQLGYHMSVKTGGGPALTIENVGLEPVPGYNVALFHPDRGSMECFHGEPSKLVFPQYPNQKNSFYCITKPINSSGPSYLNTWLHRVKLEQVAAPHFAGFKLRLVLANSEQILFEDEGLGNTIAQHIYQEVTGQRTEQPVDIVYYRSKAPFWVELLRKYRSRRIIKALEESSNQG